MQLRSRLAAAAAMTAVGLLVVGEGVASAASGGYGPTPPSNGSPGGFTSVVTSKVLGPAGGSLSASVPGATVLVTVPPGALPANEDLIITAPDLTQTSAALGSLGFTGYQAVAGLGLVVEDQSGAKFTGTFGHPLTVTLSGSSLGVAGEEVLQLNGPSSASALKDTLGSQQVSIQVASDPDLVAINPTTAAAAAAPAASVSGATTQHTGLPFRGEEDLAGVLAVVGVGALAAAARRRLRRTAD